MRYITLLKFQISAQPLTLQQSQHPKYLIYLCRWSKWFFTFLILVCINRIIIFLLSLGNYIIYTRRVIYLLVISIRSIIFIQIIVIFWRGNTYYILSPSQSRFSSYTSSSMSSSFSKFFHHPYYHHWIHHHQNHHYLNHLHVSTVIFLIKFFTFCWIITVFFCH